MKNTLHFSHKLFISAFSFLLVGTFYMVSASAFTLSPASGQLSTNQTQTVQILANTTTEIAATIRLTAANGTISNFTDGNGMLVVPECADGAKNTATTVCVSVASILGGNFTNGQVLGTFTLTKTGTAAATITAGAGSQYAGGTAVTGVLATYSAAGTGTTTTGGTTTGTTSTTGSTTGTLPNTASSSFSPTNVVILGLLVISIGLLLGVTIKVARKED